MTRYTRAILSAAILTSLTACGTTLTSTAPNFQKAPQQVKSFNQQKSIQELYQAYKKLNWKSQAGAKKQLLAQMKRASSRSTELKSFSRRLRANHATTLAPEIVEVAKGLYQEYKSASWSYNAERKRELLEVLKSFDVPAVAEGLFAEYKSLSWSYNTERKNYLLGILSHFTSPKLIQGLYQEYKSLSWSYNAERKRALLSLLGKMGLNLKPAKG